MPPADMLSIFPLILVHLREEVADTLAAVCKDTRWWVILWRQQRRQKFRTLTASEIERLVGCLRSAHVGPTWSIGRTVEYIQAVLPQTCEVPVDASGEKIEAFMDQVMQIYMRCMVVPNTCVGALDTTRTIERLTQARLSRFHTTGSVHVSFLKSGSLDSMLHPLSTTINPRMLVTLKASHVDTSCAASVIESIRGILVSIDLAQAIDGAPDYTFSKHTLPPSAQRLCQLVSPSAEYPCCLVFGLRAEVLFHHRVAPHSIAWKINQAFDGIVACVLHTAGRWVLYVMVQALARLGQRSHIDVLPTLVGQLPTKDACQDVTVNVIFDTGSTGIPQKLKPEIPDRQSVNGIMHFLQYSSSGDEVGSTVRRRANSAAAPGFAVRAGTAPRTRRRCFSGSRKAHNDVGLLPQKNTCIEGQQAAEHFFLGILRWLGHVYSQVVLSFEALPSLREDSGVPLSVLEKVRLWRAEADVLVLDGDARTAAVLAWQQRVQEPLHTMHTDTDGLMFILEQTLMRCLTVFAHVPATSSRVEMLTNVLNETVYHSCGRLLAQPYMQYRICARLRMLSLCGLEGISGAVASYNMTTKEWVVLTEGSAFGRLICCARDHPHLDVTNSTTTSIPEIVDLLGIEACYYLFTNGSLASSLGVNNHCCKLLCSHISRTGCFRGVNRNGILSGSPLDSITVEDPAKHIRDATIAGSRDNCQGSSANILLGKSVRVGTAAFDILYNVEK